MNSYLRPFIRNVRPCYKERNAMNASSRGPRFQMNWDERELCNKVKQAMTG